MLNIKKSLLIGGMAAVVGLSACTTSHSDARSAGRITDDRHITSEVKDHLASEPVYKFTNVDVKTFDGVVQLSGFVATNDQKQRAAQIAQNIQGVNRVVNGITVYEGMVPTGRSSGTNQPQMQAPTTGEIKNQPTEK